MPASAKTGVYLGEVTRICNEQIMVRLQAPLKPGDGVVFDSGHPEAQEEGGRIYAVKPNGQETELTFGRHSLNPKRIHVGDKVWKTSDPELDRHLRQSFAGDTPQFQRPIQLEIHGEVGLPLTTIARDEQDHIVQLESSVPLIEAHSKPLTSDRLQEQFGRLGNTPFRLEKLVNHLQGDVMLPISELNRLRRDIVVQLEALRSQPKQWELHPNASLANLLPNPTKSTERSSVSPHLIVLVRI